MIETSFYRRETKEKRWATNTQGRATTTLIGTAFTCDRYQRKSKEKKQGPKDSSRHNTGYGQGNHHHYIQGHWSFTPKLGTHFWAIHNGGHYKRRRITPYE